MMRPVHRTPRQIEIAEHLWACVERLALDAGTDPDAVINQAVYELARRFNFITPVSQGRAAEAPAPLHNPPPQQQPRRAQPPQPEPPRPAERQLYLINPAGDQILIDKDTFIIGRSRTCDLVIPSSKISRQHVGVVRENGRYFIEDLGSANGLFKNGAQIDKEPVESGSEYMLSDEVIRFVYQ